MASPKSGLGNILLLTKEGCTIEWHGAGHGNRWGTEAHRLIHSAVDFEASVVSGGLTSHGGDSLGLDGDLDAGPPERKTHWATKRKASVP